MVVDWIQVVSRWVGWGGGFNIIHINVDTHILNDQVKFLPCKRLFTLAFIYHDEVLKPAFSFLFFSFSF